MPVHSKKDYYKVLGIPPDASQDEIEEAYHQMAKKSHPDRGGSNSEMRTLNEAYNVLSNRKKRAEYNKYRSGRIAEQENKSKSTSKKENSWVNILNILYVVLLIGAITSFFVGAKTVYIGLESYTWQKANAVLKNGQYKYQVNNNFYTGSKANINGDAIIKSKNKTNITIYYRPNNPQQAITTPGPTITSLLNMIGGLVSVVVLTWGRLVLC